MDSQNMQLWFEGLSAELISWESSPMAALPRSSLLGHMWLGPLAAWGLLLCGEQGGCGWSYFKVLKLQRKCRREGLLVGVCTGEQQGGFSPSLVSA